MDPKIADALCEWIAEGRPISVFCRQDGMPKVSTVNEWRQKDPEFAGKVARAKDIGHDALAEQCLAIADDGSNDTYLDEEGNVRTDSDVVQRSRLRVETRLKLLACWDPRRYGQKAQLEHAGGISVQVVTGVPPQDAAADAP